MALKFCANLSFMFQEKSTLIDRYYLANQAGFNAVEVGFPYEYPLDLVKKAKDGANVQQVLINIYPGETKLNEFGFAALPGKEVKFESSLKIAIEYAKGLDCKLIHIMSGVTKNPDKEHDKTYINNLRQAVRLLESADITGVIEPINPYSLPNYYMNNYDKALEVIQEINSPNLKLQLDVFHLQLLRGNITNSIRKFYDHIAHIQIAQVPHRHEPNSEGEISYPYVFSLLEDIGYDGFIGLEYTPAGDTVKGLRWIEDYGYTIS